MNFALFLTWLAWLFGGHVPAEREGYRCARNGQNQTEHDFRGKGDSSPISNGF